MPRGFPIGVLGSNNKKNNKYLPCSHLLSIYSVPQSKVTPLNPHSPERPGLQLLVCRWENHQSLAHSHPAGKWQGQESNPGCLTPKPVQLLPQRTGTGFGKSKEVDSGQLSLRTWQDSQAGTQAQDRDGLQRPASGFGVISWRVHIEARGVLCVDRGAGGSAGDLSTPGVVADRRLLGPDGGSGLLAATGRPQPGRPGRRSLLRASRPQRLALLSQ